MRLEQRVDDVQLPLHILLPLCKCFEFLEDALRLLVLPLSSFDLNVFELVQLVEYLLFADLRSILGILPPAPCYAAKGLLAIPVNLAGVVCTATLSAYLACCAAKFPEVSTDPGEDR